MSYKGARDGRSDLLSLHRGTLSTFVNLAQLGLGEEGSIAQLLATGAKVGLWVHGPHGFSPAVIEPRLWFVGSRDLVGEKAPFTSVRLLGEGASSSLSLVVRRGRLGAKESFSTSPAAILISAASL